MSIDYCYECGNVINHDNGSYIMVSHPDEMLCKECGDKMYETKWQLVSDYLYINHRVTLPSLDPEYEDA